MYVEERVRRVEKLRDLVARLHALPRRRLTLMVGVDGPTGAGKTTFTRALAAVDPGLDVIQMEDFGVSAGHWQADGEAPGDLAPAVDWRRLRSHVLMPLSRDQPARFQRYDRATECLAEWRMVPVGGILIVEGLHACGRPLAPFYDFRVWVDAPRDVRRRRTVAGDLGPGTVRRDGVGVQADEAYAAMGPELAAHLRIDGSGAVAHDPAREYVRIRG